MRASQIFIVIIFILYSCAEKHQQNVAKQNPVTTLNLSKPDSTYYICSATGSYLGELHAIIDSNKYHLFKKGEEEFYAIEAQGDFDGDGLPDVLVLYSESGGGNCCGSEYFVYSYRGDGKFVKTQKVGNSWDSPIVEKWQGKWSFVMTSNNEGVNLDDYEEVTQRFIFDGGKLVNVEESKPVEIKAVAEMRSKEFDMDDPEKIHELIYDLDEDHKLDTIQGALYERWGRIMWEIKLGNGTLIKGPYNNKRIGVLGSKTNGMHDLVGDLNDVMKWTNGRYE